MNTKSITRLLDAASYRHDRHKLFSDWVAVMAISISNSADQSRYDEREKVYMEIIRQYKKQEIDCFCEAFAHLTNLFETQGFNDWLGRVFSEMELMNGRTGQFFTPYHVALIMAQLTLADARETIEEQGFITLSEPAVGAGSAVIASMEALAMQGIDYSSAVKVTAVDVDVRCVHMAYIQLSLLRVPAVVVHGNTLSCDEYSRWFTPQLIKQQAIKGAQAA